MLITQLSYLKTLWQALKKSTFQLWEKKLSLYSIRKSAVIRKLTSLLNNCGKMNSIKLGGTLRGQTVHWIGAQFCVCMFLDSRDKSLNMWKFRRNDQRKLKNKRRTKGAYLLWNPLTMHKMHSLASSWEYSTIIFQCGSCYLVSLVFYLAKFLVFEQKKRFLLMVFGIFLQLMTE